MYINNKKLNFYYKFLLSLILLTVYFINSYALAYLPDNYQNLSAREKQNIIWNNVSISNQQNSLPEEEKSTWGSAIRKLKSLFSLGKSFDHSSDEVPSGRIKFIHAYGSVAKIDFVPALNHPFTGIYKTGGVGIARLSLAISPEDDQFIPGMALKILLDGQPSLNIVSMYSLNGQGSNWNFFANNFSSKIDRANTFTTKVLEKIFDFTRKPSNDLPVYHLAGWDINSVKVQNPISPEKLIFEPTDSVKYLINPKSREDFRVGLMSIPNGPMYEVYGIKNNEKYHVGTLVLTTEFLASEYGDKKLFFQHKR